MNSAAWQLEGHVAKLAIGDGEVTVDLTRPSRGLDWVLRGARRDPQTKYRNILCVPASDQEPFDPANVDAFVRGRDLVATYAELQPRQVRSQVYWRRLLPEEFSLEYKQSIVAAFDLILSVNTSLLDDDPQSVVDSSMADASEICNLRVSSDSAHSFAPVARLCDSISNPEEGGTPTGCYIVRFVGAGSSYVEIVHPIDYQSTKAVISGPPLPQARLTHQLFAQRIEKGVILRARVRAGLVDRQNDEAIALAAYQHFAAAEPPLTV